MLPLRPVQIPLAIRKDESSYSISILTYNQLNIETKLTLALFDIGLATGAWRRCFANNSSKDHNR